MTINPGASFADNSITIQRLHDLVDKATLSNVQATQLATGLEGIYATQPASPAQGVNYMATLTGRIETWDGAAWEDVDEKEGVDWVYMQNWSGEDAPAGGCVVAHQAQGWARFDKPPAIGVADNAVGFANTTIASGATGRINLRGRYIIWKTGGNISAGDWVLAPLNGVWAVSGTDPTDTSGLYGGSGELLGKFLESETSGAFTAWAEIWR